MKEKLVFACTDKKEAISKGDLLNWKQSFFDSLDENALELYEFWMSYPNNFSQKSRSYFQAYSDLLREFRGRKCKLFEIGVFEGGSLRMWRD